MCPKHGPYIILVIKIYNVFILWPCNSAYSYLNHIQIKIKKQYPSQEPPSSSRAPNEDLKDMDVLCTFKIKLERQNSDHWCNIEHWSYPNQDQDAKPQSENSSVLQIPKWGHKGHWCSLHFQNQDQEPSLEHGCIKGQLPYPNYDHDAKPKSGASSILQSPNEDLIDMDVLGTFKIKMQSQNLDHGCIKDQWPY